MNQDIISSLNHNIVHDHDEITVLSIGGKGGSDEKDQKEMKSLHQEEGILNYFHRDLFLTCCSINESISAARHESRKPSFFSPGLFLELKGFAEKFIIQKPRKSFDVSLANINTFLPEAKDARYGTLDPRTPGIILYFENEDAVCRARTWCALNTKAHKIAGFCILRGKKERGGVDIQKQNKIKITGIIDYSENEAREFVRRTLIDTFKAGPELHDVNTYFEKYIDVVTTRDTSWKDVKGKIFFDYTAYVYLTSRDHMRPVLEKFPRKEEPGCTTRNG